MTTDKVVSLKGEPLDYRFTPNADLIERLEWFLEAARAGEVTGISGACVFRDMSTGTITAGVASWTMVGRIEEVKSKVIKKLED